jgi:Zn-dependent protease
LTDIILGLVAAVLAITLHEAAHGYAAWALGDDTARRAGRLSLNPLAHVDRMGTVIVPIVLLVGQLLTIHRVAFMFGWAKPVPVAAWRFKYPRQGMMVVAIAGPAMNFFLSVLGTLVLLAIYPQTSLGDERMLATFLIDFIQFNLVLGLFNLLPIPPLDGGRVVVGLLPERAAMVWAKLERVGIVIVLLLVFIVPEMSRDFGHRVDPVNAAFNRVLPSAMNLDLNVSYFLLDHGARLFGIDVGG